ncbi:MULTISPECIES: PTS ascorbate transporter subunit IIC [unclassified Luteococcus]|uniref:PTS ascorbate transporter subunit IIC n=1 Tax=unclassified Luteococcus TaxID=2639923 RepID=UPI00313D916E
MKAILDFLQSIASTPAFLVALIALLGLLLQRKSAGDTIKGTIKTFIGFLVLGAGADVVVSSLTPFGDLFQHAFHVRGVVPNNEAIVAVALKQYGTTTAWIMLLGMVFNILIAATTRFKHIFLTGHHTLYMACMFAVIFTVAGFHGISGILVGALALAAIMSLSPWMLQPFMKTMTGKDDIGLGHFGGGGYWLAGAIGHLLGKSAAKNNKPVRSTEEIKFPKGLAFLRDSTVAIGLTMMIIYIIVVLFAGPSFTKQFDQGNYLIYAITQGGKFAGGVFIILAGVRLILAEIVPAFKGISEKLVPKAIPALDCPIVFPFAPNAVLIGFIVSFIGGLVSMPVMAALGLSIVLPGVVPHFFCGATAAVFGNSRGGWKGAVAGAFVHGVAISFLPIALMPVLGSLGFAGSTFSDFDFTTMGIYFGLLGKTGKFAVIAGLALIYGAMITATIVSRSRRKPEVATA